jgi:TolB-like protein
MRFQDLYGQLEERRRAAVMGSAAVVVAIGLAAAVFAWQHWFASPGRPTVAVLPIEAMDTREETRDLADHLGKRFRLLLASRPEIRVIEYESSGSASIHGLSVAEKAQALAADYLLTGTLSGRGQNLRLSLQLYAGGSELLWSDTFEGPVDYQEQLQGWVLDELLPRLPLASDALDRTHEVLTSCAYPGDTVAILTLARVGRRGGDSATLAMVAAGHEDASLLHLAKSRFYFDQIPGLSPMEKPVIYKLGMQSLGLAARTCPDYPDIELLRLIHTRELTLANGAEFIARHPNSARLRLKLAELHAAEGSDTRMRALALEALLLDPLGAETRCSTGAMLESPNREQVSCP